MNSPEILTHLGAMSVPQFMRRHWQRRPLVIRQALPGFKPPVDRAALFKLAASDEVESRLVRHTPQGPALAHGPFQRLPAPKQAGWTLLVQGVDLHVDAAHALLARFRFISDARLDDLMISYATDGGGVGPHVDQYDVFLLQAEGRRRWRIAPPGDTRIVPGASLRILAAFEPTEEWVLEPGDLLYLPPGWGHDGVAEGPCMTYSVGFRAPSRQEFLSAFLAAAAECPGGADPRFGDRGRLPEASPARIPADLEAGLRDWALNWRPKPAEVEAFIGRWLTEPKPTVWFDRPEALTAARFQRGAVRSGLKLDRRSKMLWRSNTVFLNGEALSVPTGDRRWLKRLADTRQLQPQECEEALQRPALLEVLHTGYEAGWIHFLQA